MTIVVGFSNKPEGLAAIQHAANEARLRGSRVLVVPSTADDDARRAADALSGSGAEFEVSAFTPDEGVAERLIRIAGEVDADCIVIGLRRRSPTGKLLLGVNAQRVLLDAVCPVHAVKAP